jgi:hypothetical protein
MTGTIAEIQFALSNIQTGQQELLTNQRELANRILALETNASQQFTNLIQQVQTIQSLRLTHEREKKQIEFNNPRPELKNTEESY